MPRERDGKQLKIWAPATYRIKVDGEVRGRWFADLGKFRISETRRKDQSIVTTLVALVRDQAELTGLLNSLYELHLSILSVNIIIEENGESRHDPDPASPIDSGQE